MNPIIDQLKKYLPPIHPEGYIWIVIGAAITFFGALYAHTFGWIFFIITAWVIYFFRDPTRIVPVGDQYVVSPADGVVHNIVVCAPPEELAMGNAICTRVSIFLNIFNVHVNRVPATGVIKTLNYRPGKFLNASLDKASEDNERQSVLLTLEDGREIVFIQIAGLIAKRIVCHLEENQQVKAGERFGIIRFGSRMDIYLPQGVEPQVVIGQTAIAGETIIADLTADTPARTGEIR